MACISRSVISVAGNTGNTNSFSLNTRQFSRKFGGIYTSKFKIRASSDEADDCNVEECAPDKEVFIFSFLFLVDFALMGFSYFAWIFYVIVNFG